MPFFRGRHRCLPRKNGMISGSRRWGPEPPISARPTWEPRGRAMPSRDERSLWRHALVAALIVCTGVVTVLVSAAPPVGAAASNGMKAGGSVDEAWLTGAGAGDAVTLLHHGVADAGPHRADALGSLVVRNLAPGGGYAWHDATTDATRPPSPASPPAP